MINFLFELLTKPSYQLTILEQIIVSIVSIAIIFIVVFIAKTIIERIEDLVYKMRRNKKRRNKWRSYKN